MIESSYSDIEFKKQVLIPTLANMKLKLGFNNDRSSEQQITEIRVKSILLSLW